MRHARQEQVPESPRLGPRAEARRRALLDAAARLFAAKGFEKTTLSDVMDAAGGSRATLYELFGDKAGLFRAVMEENHRRVLDELAAGTSPISVPPEEALVRLGLHFVEALMRDDTVSVVRTLIAEGDRIPDIAELFWRSGPAETAGRVAGYLRALAEAGGFRIADPEAAAHAFLSMIVGDFFMRRLILPSRPVSPEEIDHRVRASVRLFLDGSRAPAGE